MLWGKYQYPVLLIVMVKFETILNQNVTKKWILKRY